MCVCVCVCACVCVRVCAVLWLNSGCSEFAAHFRLSTVDAAQANKMFHSRNHMDVLRDFFTQRVLPCVRHRMQQRRRAHAHARLREGAGSRCGVQDLVDAVVSDGEVELSSDSDDDDDAGPSASAPSVWERASMRSMRRMRSWGGEADTKE